MKSQFATSYLKHEIFYMHDTGEPYEQITFKNKIVETWSTSTLIKLFWICDDYGFNKYDWINFRNAIAIYRSNES